MIESHNPLPVTVSSAGSRLSVSRTAAVVESSLAVADQKRLISQLSSPFVRQDIFYVGSITSLREYKTSQDMAAYVQVYIYHEFKSFEVVRFRHYAGPSALARVLQACTRFLQVLEFFSSCRH